MPRDTKVCIEKKYTPTFPKRDTVVLNKDCCS